MKRFKNILFYAGTEHYSEALHRSITLAMENNAKLTLMDVVKPVPGNLGMVTDVATPEELQALIVQDHRRRLLEIEADCSDTGVELDAVVSVGDPAVEIVRQVQRDQHDLVVKTADGLSAAGRMFGSVALSLLRICPCPVWVLKPDNHKGFHRVLAAIDPAAQDNPHKLLNQDILELAFSIAQQSNSELHIVSAWDVWMEKLLRRRAGEDEVDRLASQQKVKVQKALDDLLQVPNANTDDIRVHLRRGSAATAIGSVAQEIEADLLVMGTVCRTGLSGFMIGNKAERVLTAVACSVLALKPSGFRSPITMSDNDAESENYSAELPWV
jgi:nucleotide-binding universal stress UspA family protein